MARAPVLLALASGATLGAFGLAAACSDYATEGSADDAGAEGGNGPIVLVDAGPPPSCRFVQDCPVLTAEPAGCAVAECVSGACLYHAVDSDFDGHPTAHCVSSSGRTIKLGDDCDDRNPQLFPGHDMPCAEHDNGGVISYPNGAPFGACKTGTRSCNGDGTIGACKGAVGPQPVNTCTPLLDEGCTGNAPQGCPCNGDLPCGTGMGQCKVGLAPCIGSKFGPCIGSVSPAPRQCAGMADFNCNGTPDNAEPECQCAGGAAPGTTRACNEHPGLDGVGVCTAGTQTCTPSGATSAWSACAGDVGPSAETCDSADRDCNGTIGSKEPGRPGCQ